LAFVGLFAINLATISFLQARHGLELGEELSGSELLKLAVDVATDPATLNRVLLFVGDADDATSVRTGYYFSNFLAGYQNGLTDDSLSVFARSAQIGHLDIVVGQRAGHFNADAWGRLLAWLTPNIGQDKQPFYLSDELVWGLGLRVKESVGFPLVTAPGEIYSISGLYGMLLITIAVQSLLLLVIVSIRTVSGYSFAYVGGLVTVLITVIMTSSAGSFLIATLRTLPLVYVGLMLLFARTSPMPRWNLNEQQDHI
jgi:hypothetical protein